MTTGLIIDDDGGIKQFKLRLNKGNDLMMVTQKVLCIGNESIDTNNQVTKIAQEVNSINYGLISSIDHLIEKNGFYHTSVTDLSPGQINSISKKFDLIMMLDQPISSYAHFKSFVTTMRLMCDLEENFTTNFRNNHSAKRFLFWRQYLQDNKSFCFYPFLALISNTDYTVICPKSENKPVTTVENIVNWQTNEQYNNLRTKMLKGEKNDDLCNDCYMRESDGQESTRQFETLEWAVRIDADVPTDFLEVLDPLYIEIRPNNLCNLMCRTCDNVRSHLIEREWKKIGIPLIPHHFKELSFDHINFDQVKRIYWGGGDPTVMPEFYTFLEKCIIENNTQFDLCIGTNGMKFSNRLIDLLSNFSDVTFSISYDGVGPVNNYIRWGSNFETIIKNSNLAKEHGHKIGLQTVLSTYNLTRLHEIFEFYDSQYPGDSCLVQVGTGHDDIFLPYNHPNPELVLDSLYRCQKTNIYYSNGRSFKSSIDLLIDYYSNPAYGVDITLLKKFYDFNDKLDQSRNSKLKDYIPELDEARKKYFG